MLMTIQEATQSAYGIIQNDTLIAKCCIDNGLNPVDTYTVSLKASCDRAAASALLYTLDGLSVTEGGFAIHESGEDIKSRLRAFAKLYGWQDVLAAITPNISSFRVW